MKKLFPTLFLTLLLGLACAPAALAQTPEPAPEAQPDVAAAEVVEEALVEDTAVEDTTVEDGSAVEFDATPHSGYVGDLTWSLDTSGTLTISGSGAMPDYRNWASSPWWLYSDDVRRIVIGSGVTHVGNYSFYQFSALTSATLESGVTSVGAHAFENCWEMTSISLPATLRTIGMSGFEDCHELVNLELPAGLELIDDSAFKDCSKLTRLSIPGSVETLGTSAFDGCNDLTQLTLSSGLTNIGDKAFNRCYGLTEVTIPGTVKTVNTSAFSNCWDLETLTLQEGVTQIASYAFQNCHGLKSVTIPTSVTSIGVGAFDGCVSSSAYSTPFTIYGYSGTAAQACAAEYGVPFSPLSTPAPAPAPTPAPAPQPGADTTQISAFVARLYSLCLGRAPRDGEDANWVNSLATGAKTGSECAYGFYFSQEFTNKNYSSAEYVTLLYRAMMGREPDAAGLQDWVGRLAAGTPREVVFNGFVGSQEFTNLCASYGIVRGDGDGISAFVDRLYRVCFNRGPDVAGFNDWTARLRTQTATGTEVAHGFACSQEMANLGLNDEQYVEAMYRAFFDREYDDAGKVDWLNRMHAQGYDREQVFYGFAGSQEFDNLCNRYGILR